MELELKHLAPYLPYELKIQGQTHKEIYTLESCRNIDLKLKESNYNTDYYDIKPILHPLSDLTKEIEVNGEKFYPLAELEKSPNFCDVWSDWISHVFDFAGKENEANILAAPYDLIQELFEWHFDVFELIKNNLAIDINKV